MGGLIERGLINFLPLNWGWGGGLLEVGGLFEREGGLIEDLRYVIKHSFLCFVFCVKQPVSVLVSLSYD